MIIWKQVPQSGNRAGLSPMTIREAGSVILIALIAWLSYVSDLPLLLFPEFGALSNCVITRPQHIWARSPYHLAFMPALTGCIGVLVERLFGFGVSQVLLVLISSLLLLSLFRSPIIPSLSSSLIPLVLDIHSWAYPLSVFLSCTILAIISHFHAQKLKISHYDAKPFRLFNGDWCRNSYHLVIFLGFIAGIAFIAHISRQQIILFPPLAVLGFEILFHPDKHPWRHSPLPLMLIFFLSATGGFLAFSLCGHTVLGIVIAVSLSICMTFWRGLYVPTAIAVSLLPFVMQRVSLAFPFEITFGVAMLVGAAMARDWLTNQITRLSGT